MSLERRNGQAGAYGSRVYAYRSGQLGDPDALITWTEIRSQDGYLAQSDPRITLGTGAASSVDIYVLFPGGNSVSLRDVATRQELRLVE